MKDNGMGNTWSAFMKFFLHIFNESSQSKLPTHPLKKVNEGWVGGLTKQLWLIRHKIG